jgi:branched-chain amino acid transport system ATP-binding protein
MSEALRVEGLSAAYGQAVALREVDLVVAHGEGLGVIGRNGAGKTTLLRTVACLHPCRSGSIWMDGVELSGKPPHEVARLGLSIVRERAPVSSDLTVVENIRLGADLARMRDREPLPWDEVWAIFPALLPAAQKRAGLLSGGQRQLLALATALSSAPSLLILDEPSAGLAAEVCVSVFGVIKRMRGEGLTVLVAEQNRAWLTGVADEAIHLEAGRTQGTISLRSGHGVYPADTV